MESVEFQAIATPQIIGNVSKSEFALIGLGALLLFYVIFALVLQYHWKTYAEDTRMTSVTMSSFYISTIPLLFVIIITAVVIIF